MNQALELCSIMCRPYTLLLAGVPHSLNLQNIPNTIGRPPKLYTCNTCGAVMGSAAVRSHKCKTERAETPKGEGK